MIAFIFYRNFFFFKFHLSVYSWLLCLCCCPQAFSNWGSRGSSWSHCEGFSLQRLLLFGAWAPGSRAAVAATCGVSCPVACGIFPDQGSNPCPLHCRWILFFKLFLYLWPCWVFVTLHRFSLVVAIRGYSSLQRTGCSLWCLLLPSTGSKAGGLQQLQCVDCRAWAQQCGTWT